MGSKQIARCSTHMRRTSNNMLEQQQHGGSEWSSYRADAVPLRPHLRVTRSALITVYGGYSPPGARANKRLRPALGYKCECRAVSSTERSPANLKRSCTAILHSTHNLQSSSSASGTELTCHRRTQSQKARSLVVSDSRHWPVGKCTYSLVQHSSRTCINDGRCHPEPHL